MSSKTSVVALTELVLTGTATEVQTLTAIAAKSGRLVLKTGPRPMGGRDPRYQVRLLLEPTP